MHRSILAAVISLGCVLTSNASFAQNRVLGANKLVLDDGQGHTITVQTPVPATTGTITLPAAGSNIANTANGTATGQVLRWNNATNQWEVSPSATNVGSTLSNAGPISATGASGTITATGNISTSANVSATGNVTAGGYLAPGSALASGTPVNGANYTDNMIQAAGFIGLTGAIVTQVGNYVVTHPSTGTYVITFPYSVPYNPIVLATRGGGSVGAFPTSLSPLTIQITETFLDGITPLDGGFTFIVLGAHN